MTTYRKWLEGLDKEIVGRVEYYTNPDVHLAATEEEYYRRDKALLHQIRRIKAALDEFVVGYGKMFIEDNEGTMHCWFAGSIGFKDEDEVLILREKKE